MKLYIALLRGINVSGHKIIKMELLRKAMADSGFNNVSTYIQSGNILFQSNEKDPLVLEKQIADIIKKHFTFDVPVIVITPDELKAVVHNNPYAEQKIHDSAQPYVAFLSETPAPKAVSLLQSVDFGNDTIAYIGKALYLLYANSAADTKLSNAIIENKLKIRATTRNWKTVCKLIELSQNLLEGKL